MPARWDYRDDTLQIAPELERVVLGGRPVDGGHVELSGPAERARRNWIGRIEAAGGMP